jgi:hypothetical protein
VPLDFGVSELIGTEYERFTAGLADLSDGGQRAARAAAARVRPSSPTVRTITVPGWDDVVHITPRPTITPEMRNVYYAAKRQGVSSGLDPVIVEEIQRRSRRAQSIQTSTAPEYAKAYGQVMTAIDNVQDLLTTVTTSGRFLLQGGARILDALGPSATVGEIEAARAFAAREAVAAIAAREAAGEIIARTAAREAVELAVERGAARAALGLGGKTLGRLVPILGPILLAADILKLLTWLGLMFFPAYAAICAGVNAGISAAALPVGQAMLGKRAGKARVGVLGKLNPFSMTARLNRTETLRSWKPSIYNLMEVAQTTDSLFGVGVSFGGLVGLVSEAAFSTEAARRGHAVRVDASELVRSVHGTFARDVETVSDPQLTDLRVASAVLAHGPVLQRTNDTFTLPEHIDFLVAQSAAWSMLRPWIERASFTDAVNLGLAGYWRPPSATYPDTGAILAAELGTTPSDYTWPLPGNPERIQGERYLRETAAEIPGALAELLLTRPDEPATVFAGAVAVQITDRATILATGSDHGVSLEWAPAWALAEGLALAGRVPVTGECNDEALKFWQRCLDEMQRSGRQQLAPATYDRLAREVGVELLQVP